MANFVLHLHYTYTCKYLPLYLKYVLVVHIKVLLLLLKRKVLLAQPLAESVHLQV